MKLPSFEEFRKSLTQEQLAEMAKRLNIEMAVVELQNEKNVNAVLGFVYNKVIQNSAVMTLDILEAYHEWLSQTL